MAGTSRVEPQEVHILRNDYSSGFRGEFQVFPIIGPAQSCVRRVSDIDVATSERIRERRWNVLVEMKRNRHRSGCFLQPLVFQPCVN